MLSQAASSQVHVVTALAVPASCRMRSVWPGGQDDARRAMPTTSGVSFRWYRWMPHPSAPRQWPQVDHWRITDDRVVELGPLVILADGTLVLRTLPTPRVCPGASMTVPKLRSIPVLPDSALIPLRRKKLPPPPPPLHQTETESESESESERERERERDGERERARERERESE